MRSASPRPSNSMSNQSHKVPHRRTCPSSSSSNRPSRPSHRMASSAGSEIAGSRLVNTVTIFSSVTGCPSTTSTEMSCPMRSPPSFSWTSRYSPSTDSSLRHSVFRAAIATPTRDWLVCTDSTAESSATSLAATDSRCVLASARYRGTSELVTAPSSSDRNSTRPDHPCGVIVVSSAHACGRCMATKRRSLTSVTRPSSSRNRKLRCRIARRTSSVCR